MEHKIPQPGNRPQPSNPRWPSLTPDPSIAMPPFRRWADLPPDLLCRIGDRLDLKCYASARGACTAWRYALAPASPSLLVVADDARCCPSAASLPTRRSFDLTAILSGGRCVGSSNGWLALSVGLFGGQNVFVLFNPITATEIVLPPLIYESRWVSKLVFAPNPAKDDFAAAAICDIDRLAYVTAGARRWAVLDPVRLVSGDQLADVVYHDKGKVYCLTRCGDVHVLRLPERHRRKPATVEDPGSSKPEVPVLSPHECALGFRARRTQQQRNLHMICYEHFRSRDQMPFKITFCSDTLVPFRRVPPGSLGPDRNAPATVEPLLSEGNLPFDPATCFAPPYNTVSVFTSAKNLVLCEGNLYQIWRNASCTVTLQLPGGGHRRVSENEILVLRYYPRRQPCWDAVTDLGGYSVFVGRNNAVSMYSEGLPGLKGNCVYWIGGRGRDQGMVFDMETGRSAPCLSSVGGIPGPPHSTICWYFLSDIMNSSNNSGGRRVYQTRARARAEREQDLEE